MSNRKSMLGRARAAIKDTTARFHQRPIAMPRKKPSTLSPPPSATTSKQVISSSQPQTKPSTSTPQPIVVTRTIPLPVMKQNNKRTHSDSTGPSIKRAKTSPLTPPASALLDQTAGGPTNRAGSPPTSAAAPSALFMPKKRSAAR